MRSNKKPCVPAASFLLLFCALHSAPRAAAQVSCTVTYNCHGSSQCASLMGGPVTLNFASAAACTAHARTVGDGTIASRNCGSVAGSNVPAAPAVLNPALANAAQTVGYALGQRLAIALFGGGNNAPDPAAANAAAQQQKDLAAHQLNDSGIFLSKQKDYAGAINEFQQALAIAPNDATIISNLALAKQRLKDVAVAGQTSDELGQFLGTTPAGVGNYDSALNLINVGPDAGVMNPQSVAETPNDPESLKGQLDGVLTNNAAAPSRPEQLVVQAQTQAIDQIFQPVPPTPSAAQADTAQKQLEDIFAGPGGTTDSAALAQQASLGQMATAAKTDEDASSLAKQGFDTAAPNVVIAQTRTTDAPATVAPPAMSSNAANLTQTKRPLVPENSKTLQIAANAGPEGAGLPITGIRPSKPGGFTALGAPIFDCEGDRASVTRLATGLPAQEEAIRRTDAAIEAAQSDSAEAREKAQLAAIKTLLASATTFSNWSEAAIAKIQGPKSAGITVDTASQVKLLELLKQIAEDSDKLIDVTQLKKTIPETYEAGYTFGNEVLVQKTAKTLLGEIEATRKILAETGVLEESAAKVALYLGPIDGPVVAALVHTIANGSELVTESAQAWNSAGEAAKAEQNLTAMRYQQMLVRDRVYELQQEVAQGCSNTKADNK